MVNTRRSIIFSLIIAALLMTTTGISVAETKKTAEIIIHYKQLPDDNTDWRIWLWEIGKDGIEYPFTGKDAFGKVATINVLSESGKFGFLLKDANWKKEFRDDRMIGDLKNQRAEIWLLPDDPMVYRTLPADEKDTKKTESDVQEKKKVRFHYKRSEIDLKGWSIWVWETGKSGKDLPLDKTDEWGVWTEFEIDAKTEKVGYILKKNQKGNWLRDEHSKSDRFFETKHQTTAVWQSADESSIHYVKPLGVFSNTIEIYGFSANRSLSIMDKENKWQFPCQKMHTYLSVCEIFYPNIEPKKVSQLILRNTNDRGTQFVESEFTVPFFDYLNTPVRLSSLQPSPILIKPSTTLVNQVRLKDFRNLSLILNMPLNQAEVEKLALKIGQNNLNVLPLQIEDNTQRSLIWELQSGQDIDPELPITITAGNQNLKVNRDFVSFPYPDIPVTEYPGIYHTGKNQFTFRTWFPGAEKINLLVYDNENSAPSSYPMEKRNGHFVKQIGLNSPVIYEFEVVEEGKRIRNADPFRPFYQNGKSRFDIAQFASGQSTDETISGRPVIWESEDVSEPEKIIAAAKKIGANTVSIRSTGLPSDPGSEAWIQSIRQLNEMFRNAQLQMIIRLESSTLDPMLKQHYFYKRFAFNEDPFRHSSVAPVLALLLKQMSGTLPVSGFDLSDWAFTHEQWNAFFEVLHDHRKILITPGHSQVGPEHSNQLKLLSLIGMTSGENESWFQHQPEQTSVDRLLSGLKSDQPVILSLTGTEMISLKKVLSETYPFLSTSDRSKIAALLTYLLQSFPGPVLIRESDHLKAFDPFFPKMQLDTLTFDHQTGLISASKSADSGTTVLTSINVSLDPLIRYGEPVINGLDWQETKYTPKYFIRIMAGILLLVLLVIAIRTYQIRMNRNGVT